VNSTSVQYVTKSTNPDTFNKTLEGYGLSDYLKIKQKYFDAYIADIATE